MLGIEPILFMASNKWFRSVLIVTDVWKGFGYGAIIYLAALSGIDPGLYEAAAIDGATGSSGYGISLCPESCLR